MARSTDDVQINTEFYPVSYSLQDSRRPTLYIPELWATRKNGWKGHMYADLKGVISTRRRKRRKGTHEKNGSAAGSVLQSSLEAAVVSAVTTHSRPRHERLNTLRPRVDGKVASVRGLKTGRDGEAARKPRGRPRSTHSMLKSHSIPFGRNRQTTYMIHQVVHSLTN